MSAPSNIRPAAAAGARVSRMTLGSVTRGRVQAPLRILLYGVPGVGKSTFAAAAPAPIVLGAEDGTNHLDVARFPVPQSWREVIDAVRLLAKEEHEYKTLVIDTLDSLEPLCWAEVVSRDQKAASIEEVGGGYAKGYTAAVDQWRSLLAALEQLRHERGMSIVLLAHSVVKTFKNPEGPDYDRYILKLHEKAAGLFLENADCALFAQFETVVEEKRNKRPKGLSTGTRVMRTVRSAAWEAKNRFDLPDPLPLDYGMLVEAIAAHRPANPADLRAAIAALLEGADPAVAEKVRVSVERVGDNAAELARIHNKLTAVVSETSSSGKALEKGAA